MLLLRMCTIPRPKNGSLHHCRHVAVSCLQAAGSALHMFLNSGQGERCKQHPPVDYWADHAFMLHVPVMLLARVSHFMLLSLGRVVMHTAFICRSCLHATCARHVIGTCVSFHASQLWQGGDAHSIHLQAAVLHEAPDVVLNWSLLCVPTPQL